VRDEGSIRRLAEEALAGYGKVVEVSKGKEAGIDPSELSRFEAPKTVRVSASPVKLSSLRVHRRRRGGEI